MHSLWDYNKNELEKTEGGRITLLERQINYGPERGKKIKLADVKRYWDRLNLMPIRRRLFELLIWGKYISSQKNNKLSWMK